MAFLSLGPSRIAPAPPRLQHRPRITHRRRTMRASAGPRRVARGPAPSAERDKVRVDSVEAPTPPAPAPTPGLGLSPVVLVAVVGALLALAVATVSSGGLSVERLNDFVDWVEALGPAGRLAYGVIYFVLELLAVPATPLTIAAGYLFGVLQGSLIVSVTATAAASAGFLIARYGLRDMVIDRASQFPAFRAIDRAISKEAFRNILLLRLSPLLPFSISNYLYGLTSVDFLSYTLASWIGMLPGTIAYVYGGAALQELTDIHNFNGSGSSSPIALVLGLGATVLVLARLGKAAAEAFNDTADVAEPFDPSSDEVSQEPPNSLRQ